jgi:hypothetical protein
MCAWGSSCPEGSYNCTGNNLGGIADTCSSPGNIPSSCPDGEFGFDYKTYTIQDRIVLLKLTLDQLEDLLSPVPDWAELTRFLEDGFRVDDPARDRCDEGAGEDCDHIMYAHIDTDDPDSSMINSTARLIAGLNDLLMDGDDDDLTLEDVYYDSGCCGTSRSDSDPYSDPNYIDGAFNRCFPIEYYTTPEGEEWPKFTVALGLPNCVGSSGTAFVIQIIGGVLPPPEIPCVTCEDPSWSPTILPPNCCIDDDCDDEGCELGGGTSNDNTGESMWIPPLDITLQPQEGSHHRTPSEINNKRDKYIGGDK